MIEIVRLPLPDITEQHLLALVDEKVAESRNLEFKLELKIATDTDKREFCSDISSFANATGGLILFGVQSGKEADSGIATGIPGIDAPNVDLLISQAEQVLLNLVSPRVLVHIYPVRLTNGKHVIAIKIPRSFISPHAVGRDGSFRFMTRGNNGKLPMDIPQIRSSFLLSEGLSERLRTYRAERTGRILANDGPISLADGHKLILHMVPLASLSEPVEYDIAPFYDLNKPELLALGMHTSYGRECNIDGVADVYRAKDDQCAKTYKQLFQNGIIEAVDAGVVLSRGNGFVRFDNAISAPSIVDHLIAGVKRGLLIYQQLGVNPPIYIMVSITGVKQMNLITSRSNALKKACDRDNLMFSEVVINDLHADAQRIMRPVIDGLWRAFGSLHCPWYKDDGSLVIPGQ